MSEARSGRDSESHQVEPPRVAPNAPNAQNPQVECLLSVKELFDQLVTTIKRDQPVATPSRAPIDQLSQHRAYTFADTIEEKLEEAEYWIERTTQILTKQLQCLDEHKLECAIALLADEALSWWETTTLTAPAEKVTWSFFVEEFKKKYISDQYLADHRKYFLHLEQGNKPIELYVAEFCKYSKYGAEYIKSEKDKCRRFTDGLNGNLSPMFTALEIEDFQILLNRIIATEAKMKVAEKENNESKSIKKRKMDGNPQGQSKKAKYQNESSMTYTPAPRSNFIPRPQSLNKPSVPVIFGNSSGKSERILPCEFGQNRHKGQCRIQSNLCYACGGDDHFIRDCPQSAQKASA
ncbi:hypothetical protein V6N13_104795 [Hibiscus sabdariffa]